MGFPEKFHVPCVCCVFRNRDSRFDQLIIVGSFKAINLANMPDTFTYEQESTRWIINILILIKWHVFLKCVFNFLVIRLWHNFADATTTHLSWNGWNLSKVRKLEFGPVFGAFSPELFWYKQCERFNSKHTEWIVLRFGSHILVVIVP